MADDRLQPMEDVTSHGVDGLVSEPADFEPVSRGERLSDKVANALTESIVSGRIAIGERLPSERELCERFAVSRPVVREAVRSLIAKGLLVDHPRRGHVVSSFGRDAVTESLTFYLRGQRLDYGKLMEVRTLIEIENAGIAAERASANQIAALAEAASRLEPNPDVEKAALADARRAHERIAKQIAARDAAGAREAMRRHLEEARRGMEALMRARAAPARGGADTL